MATERWDKGVWRLARQHVERLVEGVGDSGRQRLFRMCVTLCLHRALTEEERRGLPYWWHAALPVHLAGGPVEVLEERGIPDIPSTKPCQKLVRRLMDMRRPDLYSPEDCGECEPCRARIECRSSH